MSFSHLPFLVINQILDKVIHINELNIETWENSLQLLSVSSTWRKAAIDLVYSSVIVDGPPCYIRTTNGHSKDAVTKHKLLNSNISLIKATENTHLVRNLKFTIQNLQHLHYLIREASSIFSFKNFDWSSVHTIDIVDWSQFSYCSEYEPQSDYEQDGICFAEQLAKYMPNLKALKSSTDETGLLFTISSKLCQLYSHNLKQFELQNSNLLVEPVCFTQLTTLDLYMSYVQCVPQICSQSLQSLTLRDIPMSFSWNQLTKTKMADNIVFPKLHKLKLYFMIGDGEITNSTRLEFQALKILSITVPTLDNLAQIMNPKIYQWPTTTMRLHLNVQEISDWLYRPPGIQEQGVSLAAYIKQLIPNITHLKLGDKPSYKDAPFYSDLANYYVNQLVSADFYHPQTFTALQFSPELTHLTINARTVKLPNIPRICAESLRYLKLVNLFPNFTWSLMRDDALSGTLNFKNLESLHVNYKDIKKDDYLEYQQFTESQKNQHDASDIICPLLQIVTIDTVTINRLQKIMCFGPNKWPCVKYLDIQWTDFDITQIKGKINVNSDEYMQATSLFAKNVLDKMPNIIDMDIKSSNDCNEYIRHFVSNIFNGYAHQLNAYNCNIPVILAAKSFSPELRNLGMTIDNNNNLPLPKINAASIEYVEITGNLDKFTWDSFANNNDPRNIVFNSLFYLKLKHTDGYFSSTPANGTKNNSAPVNQLLTLHMPKVRNLTLLGIRNNNKITNASIKVKKCWNLAVGCSSKALKLFSSLDDKPILSCKISVALDTEDEMDDFYNTTNRYFKSSNSINRAQLKVNINMDRWNPQQISWPSLNGLRIEQLIKLDTLAELLAKLPNLTHLTLNNILYDAKSKLRPNQVMPISNSVFSLSVSGAIATDSQQLSKDAVKHLVLAIPSLKKVVLPQYQFNDALFVNDYGDKYPHLTNIEFEFTDDEYDDDCE